MVNWRLAWLRCDRLVSSISIVVHSYTSREISPSSGSFMLFSSPGFPCACELSDFRRCFATSCHCRASMRLCRILIRAETQHTTCSSDLLTPCCKASKRAGVARVVTGQCPEGMPREPEGEQLPGSQNPRIPESHLVTV